MNTTGSGARIAIAIVLLGITAAASPSATRAQATVRPVSATRPAASATIARRDSVYFEFQVEKPAEALPGGSRPAYPAPLSAAHVEGEVLVQFVVDTAGRVEPGTFKVLETTNAVFADAVEAALPGMRFSPAELHGRLVRQLVQQPFVFRLD
ncbi:MAG TPA: TonB family protein [Gemmatimonadaceae bacterium]|nr:TonB family protein [Gemmatimonadaceae bacterium]